MKFRTGFVSNSSTSSFILIGFDVTDIENFNREYVLQCTVPGLEEKIQNLQKKYSSSWSREDLVYELYFEHEKYSFLDDPEQGAPDGKKIVGIKLEDVASDEISEGGELSFSGFTELSDKMRKQFNLSPEHNAKLYWGTRCC